MMTQRANVCQTTVRPSASHLWVEQVEQDVCPEGICSFLDVADLYTEIIVINNKLVCYVTEVTELRTVKYLAHPCT